MTAPPADPPGRAGGHEHPGRAIRRLVTERSIIVCCGAGGVGKTTTAAVLAARAAAEGRRAVVVTIDPAKRLADALGLAGLTNDPSRVEGPWPGELWAVMLDTKGTFDRLVQRYAPDDDAPPTEHAETVALHVSKEGLHHYPAEHEGRDEANGDDQRVVGQIQLPGRRH